ncbi:MAG: SDR family NAD(P)-dependent oxidoreductase [Pseudonocardiaceae bacterium]
MRTATLVTGASSGIGLALARLFAADGHHLVLVARSEHKLHEIGEELERRNGIVATVVPADLSAAQAGRSIVDTLKRAQIEIDVLVNNAGYGSSGTFLANDLRNQLDMIQVNVAAMTELTHLMLPRMVQRRSGRILNVASTAAFAPGPLNAVYHATKAHVLSFSEALAEELDGSGVTVTALCPDRPRRGSAWPPASALRASFATEMR